MSSVTVNGNLSQSCAVSPAVRYKITLSTLAPKTGGHSLPEPQAGTGFTCPIGMVEC